MYMYLQAYITDDEDGQQVIGKRKYKKDDKT